MSNEVRDGYKKTAIGIIPDDWKINSIEEIGEVTGGSTPRRSNPEYWGGDIPWLTLSQISDELINTISETEEYMTKAGLENSSAKLLPKGTVMLSSRATIGECLINEVPMTTNQGFANIICDRENIDNYFLMYLLRYNKPRLEILGAGSTFSEVSRTSVRSFNVPVPPLPEQKKIADILSAVDQAIEKTDQIIAKTKELKQGLMQELLTKGIGHDEFKEVRIGPREVMIPENWEVKTIKEIAKVKGGKRVPKGMKLVEEKTPYPYIRVSDFNNNSVDNSNMKYATEKIYEEISRYTISKDDVYISIAGTIGLVGVVPPELDEHLLTENAAKIVIKDKNKVYNKFLSYSLAGREPQSQIDAFIGTTGVPKLSLTRTKKIMIPLPPYEEQKKIFNILSSVDNKIQKKQEQKEKLEELKTGLMQKLLTGKVRVDI